eukprot:6281920-Amphidinium_carterae.1
MTLGIFCTFSVLQVASGARCGSTSRGGLRRQGWTSLCLTRCVTLARPSTHFPCNCTFRSDNSGVYYWSTKIFCKLSQPFVVCNFRGAD